MKLIFEHERYFDDVAMVNLEKDVRCKKKPAKNDLLTHALMEDVPIYNNNQLMMVMQDYKNGQITRRPEIMTQEQLVSRSSDFSLTKKPPVGTDSALKRGKNVPKASCPDPVNLLESETNSAGTVLKMNEPCKLIFKNLNGMNPPTNNLTGKKIRFVHVKGNKKKTKGAASVS